MTTEFLHSARRHASLCVLSPWHIHWILLRMPHWVRHPQTCFSCVQKWHRSSNRHNCLGRLVVGFGWRLLQLVSKVSLTKYLASCVKWRLVFLVLYWDPKQFRCCCTQQGTGTLGSCITHLLLIAVCYCWFPSLSNFASCCLPHDSALICLVSKGWNHNPNLPTAWHVSGMTGKRGAPFSTCKCGRIVSAVLRTETVTERQLLQKHRQYDVCKYNYICKKHPVASASILTYRAVDWTMTSCG